MACNCSICGKRGHLLVFVNDSSFHLQSGADKLTDYQFGRKVIHHKFCSTCGVGSFSDGAMPDGTKMKAVNARCLDGFDCDKYPVKHFDGASL